MNGLIEIERSMAALEKLLGVSLTFIDNRGFFHTEHGAPIFSTFRQSHKKNSVCGLVYCNKCSRHCRYEMLEKAQNVNLPFFFHRCWAGMTEVVAPVRRNEICLGLVYAGIWKIPGQYRPDNIEPLPAAAAMEYAKLDEFNEEFAFRIGCLLELLNSGITAELNNILFNEKSLYSRKDIIRDFIFKYSSGKTDLRSLAKKLSLSPSRTSHLIKELFGKSLAELIIGERINRAKNLLLTTDLPVGKIADMAGFPDQFSFSKIFKRVVNCPPGEFRKSKQREPGTAHKKWQLSVKEKRNR